MGKKYTHMMEHLYTNYTSYKKRYLNLVTGKSRIKLKVILAFLIQYLNVNIYRKYLIKNHLTLLFMNM